MSGPGPSRTAWWLVLFFVPLLIWLAVFAVLADVPGFAPVMQALAGACDGALSVLPGCADLDAPQRRSPPVPREFLAASYIVTLAATGVTLVLAALLGAFASLRRAQGDAPERDGRFLWLALLGIVAILVLFLPLPSFKAPNSSLVSVLFCLMAGAAAIIVYLKVVALRARLARGRRRVA